MKKNTKRVFRDFRYLECSAFADYLHEMSLKGWHFTSWKFGLIFEKGEPEDIVYAVEVFPKGRENDSQPGSHFWRDWTGFSFLQSTLTDGSFHRRGSSFSRG